MELSTEAIVLIQHVSFHSWRLLPPDLPTFDLKEAISGDGGSRQRVADAGIDVFIKSSQRQHSFADRLVFSHVKLVVQVVDDWGRVGR